MQIDAERITFRCGHSVRRANLQPKVLDLLLPTDKEAKKRLYDNFLGTVRVSRPDVARVMRTAERIAGNETSDLPTAFALWLLAVSERQDFSLSLEEIAALVTNGDIPVSDFLLQEES